MLRTSALRVTRLAAGRVAARTSSAPIQMPTPWTRCTANLGRAVPWSGVRFYSAAGGLDKAEVEGRIIALLTGFDKVNDPSNIKATAHFSNDLGLDSLDTVEVVMAIEEEFSLEIPDKDADTIHSVDKAVEYILGQPDAH